MNKFPRYEGKESDLQIACMDYLHLRYPKILAFHVKNEGISAKGWRALKYGAQKKREGVLSGVPDCLIIHANSVFNGLAIELKVKGGSVSLQQKSVLERFKIAGWETSICWSLDEFMYVVDKYINQ